MKTGAFVTQSGHVLEVGRVTPVDAGDGDVFLLLPDPSGVGLLVGVMKMDDSPRLVVAGGCVLPFPGSSAAWVSDGEIWRICASVECRTALMGEGD